MLTMEAVTKSFAGPEGVLSALSAVSLGVQAGEFVAVCGPSGSGKTTLLLVAGGLLTPTQGSVRLEGADVYGLKPEARNRLRATRIGFVFQQFHLLPYLTVLENVMTPSLAVAHPGAESRARELISHFGLDARARHLPSQLSTGEKQRAALARALLNEPALILADEPTGNLDDASGTTVLNYLAEFAENGGAVLMVTHDRAATEKAQRTVRMRDGKLTD